MMLSKAEKQEIITLMMQNHKRLCPHIFEDGGKLHAPVRDKLTEVAGFVEDGFLSCFPGLIVRDITLNGSMCSYVYSDSSDIDLFVVVDDIFPDNSVLTARVLNEIDVALSSAAVRPSIYGHPVDFGVLQRTNVKVSDFNSYSLKKNCWKMAPVRREFNFTPQELYRAYCGYSADLHRFAAGLPKTADGFLTGKSRDALQNFLSGLRIRAFECKEFSAEHEYGLDYNLYRLLKRFGAWKYFRQYITDSYKNDLRRNE